MAKKTIAQLEAEIAVLKNEAKEMTEELKDAGLRERVTLLSQIEDREDQARRAIQMIAMDCARDTGRQLEFFPVWSKVWTDADMKKDISSCAEEVLKNMAPRACIKIHKGRG